MLANLLLDLDDTLLGNPMAEFIPAYFQALTRYAEGHVDPARLVPELLRATAAMDAGDGTGPPNEEAFAAVFYPALGVERAALEPIFTRFYEETFPRLRALVRPRPQARRLVEWAFANGVRVVIATNPIFPRRAIEHRLEWAGIPVSEYPYTLVTCYENMHATKSHPAYYSEILHRLGGDAAASLMVGDDWTWDVVQPTSVGIAAVWVGAGAPPEPTPPLLHDHGSFEQVAARLMATSAEALRLPAG